MIIVVPLQLIGGDAATTRIVDCELRTIPSFQKTKIPHDVTCRIPVGNRGLVEGVGPHEIAVLKARNPVTVPKFRRTKCGSLHSRKWARIWSQVVWRLLVAVYILIARPAD